MNSTVLITGIAFTAIFVGLFAADDAYGAVFAKYDGIDGEARNETHETDKDGWISLLSFDWEANQQSIGASGQSRRRGAAIVEDVTLSMEYEKSSPKLQEALLTGKVIPKVDVYLTKEVPCPPEPREPTDENPNQGELCEVVYLKYELKNVMISSYQTSWADPDEVPEVVTGNNFEEIKVTYTEYDDDTGENKGNVETTWKVEKGTK
ncbi:MAG: Hcp family type VI secretion system effector [Nitrosopumilaceae archaeon]